MATSTITITDPEAVTAALGAIDAEMPPCPAFCNDKCGEFAELPGDAHHSSGFDILPINTGRDGETADLWVSTSRTDEDWRAGTPDVNVLTGRDGFTLTAAKARQLAAMLMNAADNADPLPYGQMPLEAQLVRVGDEILTADGWQHVVGQMAFGDNDQVNVWTDVEDHDPDTDGWEFKPGDLVRVRRRIHGSCAIAFEEPS